MRLLNPISTAIQKTGYWVVSEELGWWVKGHSSDFTRTFEVSFEDGLVLRSQGGQRALLHEKVPATYLGIWEGRRTIGEFQLGSWFKYPTGFEDGNLVVNFILSMRDVPPHSVARVSTIRFEASPGHYTEITI